MSNEELIAISIISFLITLIILYQIILNSVSASIKRNRKELIDVLMVSNNLKAYQMFSSGIPREEIQRILSTPTKDLVLSFKTDAEIEAQKMELKKIEEYMK